MNVQLNLDLQIKPASPLEALRCLIDHLARFQLDIEAALEYGQKSHSFDDVAKRVLTGDLRLYPLTKSFVLTEIRAWPNYNAYHVYLAGGDLQEILSFIPTLARDTLAHDCRFLTMTGRPGWVRTLKARGWSHELATMYLEV